MPDEAEFCGVCGARVEAPETPPSEQPTMKVAREAKLVPPPTAPPPAAPPATAPADAQATTVRPGASAPPPPPPASPAGPPPIPAGHGPSPYGPAGGVVGGGAFGPGGRGPGGYGPGGYQGPGMPPKKSRLGMWIGIGVAAAIVIAAGVTVPLLLLDKDDESAGTSTTRRTSTTTTTTIAGPGTSATSSSTSTSTTTTSSTTTTTTVPAGPPGDSAGKWAEISLPAMPLGTYAVSVSDQALLMEVNNDAGRSLFAYLLGTGQMIELPLEGSAPPTADLDGLLAVWQEADYNADTGDYANQRVCAYLLPSGDKVQVATGNWEADAYPQVALPRVSWTLSEPWESNPEEYWAKHIYTVEVDPEGRPAGEAREWVSMAPAYMYGDSGWVYSLSGTHLAWENHAPHHLTDAGTSAFAFGDDAVPFKLGTESWRPSLAGEWAVYYDSTLMAMDLTTMVEQEIDPRGDYATAGPTFAAYYRMVEAADSYTYEIVARGYTGTYEQVIAETEIDPYFSAPIAASGAHIALVLDDQVRLFEWQAGI